MARQDPAAHHRPEIQGLRAVAVLLVLGYHLVPARLTGGYVGVDVFFVISGFLITSHLRRELAETGTLSPARFWARRARRLLPAALLVLGVCTVATWALLPQTLWDQTLRQIVASALYWQNWALASDAVDYSARGNTATLVQHYWSLSVEEQFYLGWPLLLLAVTFLLRRRTTAGRRRGLVVAVAVVALASLACSVLLTRTSAASAYFVTQTRVWELAAGALLALVGVGWVRGRTTRLALGWVGVVAVLVAALRYDDRTPFPGWAALVPVLGAVAVLAAGGSSSPAAAAYWLGRRPARFLGDISYAVYLWHWPLVVLLPHLTGSPLRHVDMALVLVLTIALAWGTTRLVEDPVRRVRLEHPVRVGAVALAGMLVVVAASEGLQAHLHREVASASARTASALAGWRVTGCLGPPALDPRNRCGAPTGRGPLLSAPAVVTSQNSTETFPGCQADQDTRAIVTCTLGDAEDPRRTVALVGDSHATMWFPALDAIGRREHWKVVTFTKSSCPFTTAVRALPGLETGTSRARTCARANEQVTRALLDVPGLRTVLVAAFPHTYSFAAPSGQEMPHPATDGFRLAWQPLERAGMRVVVLRDVPAVKDLVNTPDCLQQHERDVMACALPRSQALEPDAQAEAAHGEGGGQAAVVDLTPQFCDARWCYPVVGDVIVYRDYSHLSREYSRLLAPYLARALADTADSRP